VSRACGLSRKAIRKGIRELEGRGKPIVGRIRRPGAGRKAITQSDPILVQTLEGLIDEQTRGDRESALRWICKSTRSIAGELGEQNHPVSHMKVAQMLHDLDYVNLAASAGASGAIFKRATRCSRFLSSASALVRPPNSSIARPYSGPKRCRSR